MYLIAYRVVKKPDPIGIMLRSTCVTSDRADGERCSRYGCSAF